MTDDLVARLAVLLGPILVAAACLASRARNRLVPFCVFALGTAAVAGRALLLHDWVQHEAWFYFSFGAFFAFPPLLFWQAQHALRSPGLKPILRSTESWWYLLSLCVGALGAWAAWASFSHGMP